MPYIITTTLKPHLEARRLEIRPQHLAYLKDNERLLLAGGARITDDGEGTLGGLFIVDSEDRADAEAFIANEPLNRAGMFQEVTITRWRKALFDHKRAI